MDTPVRARPSAFCLVPPSQFSCPGSGPDRTGEWLGGSTGPRDPPVVGIWGPHPPRVRLRCDLGACVSSPADCGLVEPHGGPGPGPVWGGVVTGADGVKGVSTTAWASITGLIGGPAPLSSILALLLGGLPYPQHPSLHLSQLIKRFQEKQTHQNGLLWSVQEQRVCTRQAQPPSSRESFSFPFAEPVSVACSPCQPVVIFISE